MTVFWVIVGLVLFFWIIIRPRRRSGGVSRAIAPPPIPPAAVLSFEEATFDAWLVNALGAGGFDHWFFTTIAGTSHCNNDGTSRTDAIQRCSAYEPLELVHEEANAYSAHAVAIISRSGEQLGYLPDRTGGEIVRDKRRGRPVIGVFGHKDYHPRTGQVVGAVIAVVRLRMPD